MNNDPHDHHDRDRADDRLKTGADRLDDVAVPCDTPDQLHDWVRRHLDLRIPRRSVCAHHQAPFDYLCSAYFEPARDLVVWAPRGGGKTRLAAAATLLDLLHKPGCSVRILGGSMEQSLRMWEHLLPDIERLAEQMLLRRPRSGRRIVLQSGSQAAVTAQSQRAVRGLRVQKLRCDEVELFKPEIWEAAQLVTRSRPSEQKGPIIRGAIEAISTFHAPFGLMRQILQNAELQQGRVLKWCLLEVLQRCEPQRSCATCPLWDECRGIAKQKCDGFISIDDAITMKRRVSRETWDAEMLCRRPLVSGCVFPNFSADTHICADVYRDHVACELCLAMDFGFADPFVCLWVRRFADGVTHVIDEYVQPMRTMEEHLQQLRDRGHGQPARVLCDPAGAGRSQQTAISNVQILRAAGYTVRYRASRIIPGLEMIRAALRPAHGAAKLFFHPRCARLIHAMQAYRYPDKGGELPLKDGTHDHLIDALRYYFVNRDAIDPCRRRY